MQTQDGSYSKINDVTNEGREKKDLRTILFGKSQIILSTKIKT